MELVSDVVLKGSVWVGMIDLLKDKFFKTQWELYALCIALGIMYDQQKDNDAGEDNFRTIGRNVLLNPSNSSLLDFMFQTAILTTKQVELDEKERLELAFGKDESGFKKMDFLTRFANYGVEMLNSELREAETDLEIMEVLMTYMNQLYENDDYSMNVVMEDLEEY